VLEAISKLNLKTANITFLF